jgi:membrane-bound lytic murein transglycosylase
VPRIADLDGLTVKLYFNDHPPPHVHVYAGRVGHPGVQMARISTDTGKLIDGQLASAKVATVRDWCARHRDAQRSDWQRAQRNLHPTGRYDQ